MTENDDFVEIQGTAEGTPFTGDQLSELIDLARSGIRMLIRSQRRALDITGAAVWKFPPEEER
jgi:ribonuclease PH